MSLPRRVKASLLHLGGCIVVAALAAALVMGVWYPMPYWYLSGGQDLLVLMLSVDLVLGPVLTLVAASPAKTPRHLAMDISVIVLVQLVALGWGLFNVWQVRPVAMVAEYKMLRVVVASDILDEDWVHMPEGMGPWSLHRPVLMGVRAPRDQDERQAMTRVLIGGKMPGSLPRFWQPYAQSREQVLAWAQPLDSPAFNDEQRRRLQQAATASGQSASTLKVLPIAARDKGWVALVDAQSAEVKGYAQFPQ